MPDSPDSAERAAEPRLLPCPHCGSDNVRVAHHQGDRAEWYEAQCFNCSQIGETAEIAAEFWNWRADRVPVSVAPSPVAWITPTEFANLRRAFECNDNRCFLVRPRREPDMLPTIPLYAAPVAPPDAAAQEPQGNPRQPVSNTRASDRLIPVAAAPVAPLVPAGWKLVPIEPTKEMLEAAGPMANYDFCAPGCSPDYDHVEWWRSMLAAAPALVPNEEAK